MKTVGKTEEIFDRLCEVIPGGVNSPVRSCKAMGQLPLIPERAVGDLIYDVEGRAFIDYCGSWGPLILGHAHPTVLEATIERARKGTTFGLTTEIEEQLARKVVDLVPSVELIRFVSSGTEATMSAARLARGFTGRDIIVKFNGNYHGHADLFLVKPGSGAAHLSSSAGIPSDVIAHTVSLPYNDSETCRNFLKETQVAAVIVEPIAANMGVVPGDPEFIAMLRDETEQQGALLIFDEVISGFRLGLDGAQGLFGISPDLSCFGKIIGGGFPAAAFGGRRDVMELLAPLGPVYQAGTLSGNPVAMEGGLQTLKLLEREGFYSELEAKTRLITDPLKSAGINVTQVGSLFTIFFDDPDEYPKFFRYLFTSGIYAPPSQQEAWFVSAAHTEEHLVQTRDRILEFCYQ